MTINLIFPAILVFALMLIGVVLTVIEFNRMERDEQDRNGKGRDSGKN